MRRGSREADGGAGDLLPIALMHPAAAVPAQAREQLAAQSPPRGRAGGHSGWDRNGEGQGGYTAHSVGRLLFRHRGAGPEARAPAGVCLCADERRDFRLGHPQLTGGHAKLVQAEDGKRDDLERVVVPPGEDEPLDPDRAWLAWGSSATRPPRWRGGRRRSHVLAREADNDRQCMTAEKQLRDSGNIDSPADDLTSRRRSGGGYLRPYARPSYRFQA